MAIIWTTESRRSQTINFHILAYLRVKNRVVDRDRITDREQKKRDHERKIEKLND